MTGFVEMIRPYLPFIGVALALLGVLILLFLVLHLRKSAKPAAAPSPAADPIAAAPAATANAAAEQAPDDEIADYSNDLPLADEPVRKADHSLSLNRVLSVLRGRRYVVPWYAMVGAPGSGKTSLIQAVDAAPDRLDGGPSASGQPGWWLFDEGAVIDVPGSLFLSGDGPRMDQAWRRFLHRLRQAGTRKPLNGLILTISSEDLGGLAALDRDRLLERGRDLHTRLRVAQEILGLRLPVYVVVSKCDMVSGFTSYWAAQPERRRSEMFGWANPNSLDTAYRSEWIDQAFEDLSADLFRGQIAATETLDVGDPRAPGMVLFPSAFRTLQQPLQTILSMIFQPTAYHEAFFFRGLWFTGALPPDAEFLHRGAAQRAFSGGLDVIATVSTLAYVTPRPILLRHLLRKKIFPERAVARPLARSWRTDSRSVRRAKLAAVAALALFSVGLGWSAVNLQSYFASLQQALGVVRQDMDRHGRSQAQALAPLSTSKDGNEARKANAALDGMEGMAPPSRQSMGTGLQIAVDSELKLNAARAMLDALGATRSTGVTTLFMPTSWFSSLGNDIAKFLSQGFEHVVLDAMEIKLAQRAHRLIGLPFTLQRDDSAQSIYPASMMVLKKFIDEMDALNADVQRYNNLGTPDGAQALPDLVHTLMGIDLPPGFNKYPDLLQTAMQSSQSQQFPIERYRGPAAERTTQLFWLVLNDLTEKGELASALRHVASSLQNVQNGGQDADGRQLLAIRDETNHVTSLLTESWWSQVANGSIRDGGSSSQLLVRIGNNSFLGPELRDSLTTDVQGALRRFRSKLTAYSSPLTGPLLVEQPSGGVTVSPRLIALSQGLDTLFSKDFMTPVPVEVIPQVKSRIDWDRERLERAVQLWREYDTTLVDGLPQFPQALRPRIQAVMDQRLVNGMVWHISHAMRVLPADGGWQGPVESAVATDVASLKQATQPLGLLINAFNETGSVVQRDDLSDAVSNAAQAILVRIDGLLNRDTLYLPLNSVDQWTGNQPVTSILFNAPDDVALQQYLSYQRDRAHRLTVDYAEPVLSAFAMADTGRNSAARPLVTRWQRLFQDVDAYYQRRPGSTLVQLESFIRFGLSGMLVGNCAERLLSLNQPLSTGDYFLARQADLLAQVNQRCDALNGGSGTTGSPYATLAEAFNQTLAGRYPFADSPDGQGLRAATPADIKTFFATLDTLLPRIQQDMASGRIPLIQRQQMETFLTEMEAVRTFLAPLLDGKPGGPPGAYSVAVDFRVNQTFERNGNQILTWTAAIGAQAVQDPPLSLPAPGAPAATLRWQWGDPLSLRLRWAKDSPLQPYATAGGQPAFDAPSTAVFSYRDPWSLITLLRLHQAQLGQVNPALQPAPNLTAFSIPTRNPASAGPPQPGSSTPPSDQHQETVVFVRFGLTSATPAADGKTVSDTTLVLPPFPTHAPTGVSASRGTSWAN